MAQRGQTEKAPRILMDAEGPTFEVQKSYGHEDQTNIAPESRIAPVQNIGTDRSVQVNAVLRQAQNLVLSQMVTLLDSSATGPSSNVRENLK